MVEVTTRRVIYLLQWSGARLNQAIRTIQADCPPDIAQHIAKALADNATPPEAIDPTIAAKDAEIEALRAENERLKSKNRTEIKAAFFDGWDAARKGSRSDAWEHSRTRQRIDCPSAALKDPQP